MSRFERITINKNNPNPITKELHDCGIIYYPERPYLLCVMTEGNDLNELAGVIQNISKTVYEWTAKREVDKGVSPLSDFIVFSFLNLVIHHVSRA